MNLLHIDSSILGGQSVSRQVSAAAVAALVAENPGAKVTYRDLDAGSTRLARALLRRPRTQREQADVYDDGSVLMKFTSHEVGVNGRAVDLTPTEFRLLAALVKHHGQTLSAEQLLELAWNDPFGVGPERVKFGVMRLRRKLGQPASAALPIEAVRGFGYRYVPPAADMPPLG